MSDTRLDTLLDKAAEQQLVPGGGIVLAATPVGNPLDASIRLIHALQAADIIAAEDTRTTKALADYLGIQLKATLISNHDHNEQDRAQALVDHAQAGKLVLLVSDAGMPVVSDPGFALITLAHEQGVPVTCLPGPSAVPTALVLSGLSVGHFSFLGFAPRKDGARRDYFTTHGSLPHAWCFFESPRRLAATLRTAAEVLGETRAAAVCRELTKAYEEVRRGGLGELARWAEDGVKGEICVVIDAAPDEDAQVPLEELVAQVEALVAEGVRMKEAAGQVAARHQLSKRDLYQAVLDAR
ncbi:MAG TPA: 16S rRNA (cytidine(1402)-2'-O)-methyltransferase [Candidatus Corynebacterium gallistercoris]|uniref:Ribosomal RNA small subunit methyltransferase I n=1 Tax=Candidatus Corynebacterium gallistercoris TaxID=2838530 RepID=A0A9D1RX29_9CORY|nr:16S rRNA (cytidine(1402)-2'-O)-methyltransferase [Candidatus Corynebacterium gallistercoris]